MSKKKNDFPFSEFTRTALRLALEEDLGPGDLTTDLLVPAKSQAQADIWTRSSGLFCGEALVREIFTQLDSRIRITCHTAEGSVVKARTRLMTVRGNARAILKGERTALNLLARIMGIAELTREFVQRVRGQHVLILDTRKTTPLWREIEKYAVRMGGGKNHRMGLYDAVFVKENHRLFGTLKPLKKFHGRFEIEVRNMKELREALQLEPKVILFDNFSPDALRRAAAAARKKHPHIILEASGGITLENAAHYAAMGIDWISVGALTHSAKPADLSLLIRKK